MLSKLLRFDSHMALSGALIFVVIAMLLPPSRVLLDFGLACSFAMSILILILVLYSEKPFDFSIFPGLVLFSMMFRLMLNVSSTKLILGNGHAGERAAGDVLRGFASFVMMDGLFIGCVVFVIFIIVNFMILSKGATRMAEVSARFALDAMPGRQLAIDSDLSSGAITQAEATTRRAESQAETNFYGSLDGASKFVKGDAIAGLIITGINLLVGISVGIVSHDMAAGDALSGYTFLTIGDGLVSQLPALIIALATGLLLSRGGNPGAMGDLTISQIRKYPKALFVAAGLMLFLAFFPGLPVLPFLGISAVLCVLALRLSAEPELGETNAEADQTTDAPEQLLGDFMDLDDIHITFAPEIVDTVLDPVVGLAARIANIRQHVATSFGLALPEIRLSDDSGLPDGTYRISVQGSVVSEGTIYPSKIMVLQDQTGDLPDGDDTVEPVYQTPARWVPSDRQDDLVLTGRTVVTPAEILATHLLETIKSNLGRLMTLKVYRRTIDAFVTLSDGARSEENRRLIEDHVPDKLPKEVLHQTLKALLDEQVSIRNLAVIVEAAIEGRNSGLKPEAIVEHVRQKLGPQLVDGHKSADGTLPIAQLDAGWEEIFVGHEINNPNGLPDVGLPPETFHKLTANLRSSLETAGAETLAVLAVPSKRRRFMKAVIAASGLSLPVLSFEEIGLNARPNLIAKVPV